MVVNGLRPRVHRCRQRPHRISDDPYDDNASDGGLSSISDVGFADPRDVAAPKRSPGVPLLNLRNL